MFGFWYCAEGITGVIALLVGLLFVGLLISGLETVYHLNEFQFGPTAWAVIVGVWLVALFLLFRIATTLWKWKPYSV